MAFTKKIFFRFFALLCVIVSFFIHSPLFTHHFNSDHAVNVLMAFDMEFPQDYYYWGQTRLGSLVPFLGYIITHLFNLEPIIAISLVQYGLMTAACFIFSRYIKNCFLKCCFFVFWFFPVPIFPEIVYLAQPYAGQFFLIGLAILWGEKYYYSEKTAKNIFLLFSFLALGISVWVSELSGLFLVLFAAVFGLTLLFKPVPLKNKIKEIVIYLILFLSVSFFTFLFVTYAKSNAIGQTYSDKMFIGLTELMSGLKRHWSYLVEVLKRPAIYFDSIGYMALFITGLGVTAFYAIKRRQLIKGEYINLITLLFFLNAVLSTLFVYLSDWVSKMNFEFRYWTYSFASLGIFLFFYWDGLYVQRKKVLTVLISLICFFQVITSVRYAYEEGGVWAGFKLADYRGVKKLGNCGLIGSYWYSYLCSAVNPKQCVASPHDNDFVRNARLIPKLVAKDSIYLVKNDWLNNFPDTVYNFGILLKKAGAPFNISSIEMCLYLKEPYHRVFRASYLNYKHHTYFADSTLILNKDTANINDCVVSGPLRWLNNGKYKATFYINKGITKDTSDKIIFDVCTGWGNMVYTKRELKINEINDGSKIVLEFELKEATPFIEYRIFLKGQSSFVFIKTEVIQR